MRLKSIKLSGFKSFVDPTQLRLPGNLIGVVGPNGCGKSNIIDAVRWVMGESSARHLRGESMSDVIFNGSSQRKPVSTATVELVFDNSEGRAGGEYASYAEISVKRQVTRDGQSLYFLNNTRCRRRDITDIFLGTGLGPRSYSIIEQGMISRIVESKPEEMRVYLEEAAGISKYKERRRETEHRIRRTRDNLERLGDLREEVGKHLERLDRQARQAERYKLLKAEQERKKAEARALAWREIDRQQRGARQEMSRLDKAVEEAVAQLRKVESEAEERREAHALAQEEVAAIQAELYRVGSEIGRVEQSISHRKESHTQGQRAIAEARRDQQQLESHLDLDRAHLAELRRAIETGDPELAEARRNEEQANQALAHAEATLAAIAQRWETFKARQESAGREAEVGRARIAALDRSINERSTRLKELASERGEVSGDETRQALEDLNRAREEQAARVETIEEQVARVAEQLAGQQVELRDARDALSHTRDELRTERGRLQSLEVLQEAALGEDAEEQSAWLRENGLEDAPRLAKVLKVDAGVEAAVEAVLAPYLDAVVVDDPWAYVNAAAPPPGLTLVAAAAPDSRPSAGLGASIDGPHAIYEWLGGFELGESARESGATVRTDGLTGSANWLTFPRTGPAAGVLGREREIRESSRRCEELKASESSLAERVEAAETRVASLVQQREQMQSEFHSARRRISELEGQIEARQTRLRAIEERIARLEADRAALHTAMAKEQEEVREVRGRLETALESMAGMETERTVLEDERRQQQQIFEQARQRAREAQAKVHQLAVALESRRAAEGSTSKSVRRSEERLAELREREAALRKQADELLAPMAEEEKSLETQLAQRLDIEKKLTACRTRADELAAALRDSETRRQAADREIAQRRDALSSAQVRNEGFRVRAEAILEELERTPFKLEALLEELAEEATAASWEAEVQSLESKIRRLEPVNLAAIDEYKEELERKTYLDAQNEDLERALETLESAIAQIDRKTRTRFKETFERVNKGVQELFPRLFGGGHAYLELTGDDLLSTGVAIMARPPGKRVTNIHLLSGGEKALTAVAVVFAIFRLNPAPFCMLDEVDAPLDDANVGRFSELVKEMSEQVQFLVVTHNKITMEIAHQLMGVTMREPGVSRMVSVDVAEAARLASE